MSTESSAIVLKPREGVGEVHVLLPMNMELVGEVLVALGNLNFFIPDAVGKAKMTVSWEGNDA